MVAGFTLEGRGQEIFLPAETKNFKDVIYLPFRVVVSSPQAKLTKISHVFVISLSPFGAK